MKKMNKFGLFAFVLTALAMLVPATASAAGGNIRRMDSTTAYPATAPARIGSQVTFRMILDNNTKNAPYDMPFRLLYQGLNSADIDLVLNPPMIGVTVSGTTRYAKLVNIGPYAGTSTQLTAIDFAYDVEPGDMASPMEVVANDTGSGYVFLNMGASSLWRICDTNAVPTDADFSFGGKGDTPDGVSANANYNLRDDAVLSLGCGAVYIETMDFDTVKTDDGYWREIPATTEIATPRIVIPGGATTNGTVYVWVSDATGKAVIEDVTFGNTMKTQKNAFGQDVHPVSFTTGDTEVFFSLYGKTEGAEAIVYMCAEPQNTFATGDYLVSNFVYRTVKVTKAPEPAIKFKLDRATVSCGTNWQEQVAILTAYIEPAQTLPEDLTVELNMKSGSRTAATLFATNSIRVSDVALGTPSYLNKSTTVTIKQGSSSGQAYLYALGAEKEKISFTPSYPASESALVASLNLRAPVPGDGCELQINASDPVLEILDSDAKSVVPPVFALMEKKAYTFYLALADGYRCSQGVSMPGYPGYTVKWDRESDKAATAINPQTFTNISPITVGGRLVLPVTITYPYAGAYTNTKIRVTNPDGGFTEMPAAGEERIQVNVGASMKAYANTDHENNAYGEGENARVTFTLSEQYVDLEGNVLYAFLEPLNEDATNCTKSSQWIYDADGNPGTAGIEMGGTESVGAAIVELLDGYSEKKGYCTPRFGVRFCTTKTYDPATEVTDYSISAFSLAVTNIAPWTMRMQSGDDIVSKNGSLFETPVVMDIENKFTIVVGDKSTVDLGLDATSDDAKVAVRWGFKGATDKKWTYVWKFGLDADAASSASYAFTEPNSTNNQIKVTVIDKDMREPGDITWVTDDTYEEGGYWKVKTSYDIEAIPTFSAFVSVTDQPMVLVEASKDYFTEEDFVNGNAYFTVSLTETADKALEVTLFVERLKTIAPGTANPGILMPEDGAADGAVIKAKHVFNRGKGAHGSTSAWRVTIEDLDGTILSKNTLTCYKIYAKVTSPGNIIPNGGTTAYRDIYGYQTLSPFQVWNTEPELLTGSTTVGGFDPNTETNRYSVERNVPITASWKVHDIPADLTNNLAVTVHYGLKDHVVTYTAESTVDMLSQTVSGTFDFTFTDPGDYTVSIKAADKDNGYVIQYWYFTVASSKNVFIRALVQDGAAMQSDTGAKPYTGAQASGKGSGRVWAGAGADTGFLFSIDLFKHQWIYKPSARTSTFFAKGYAVGDVEGTLTPNDQDIDTAGNRYASGEHYAYTDALYDSFFYRFAVSVAGDGGNWSTTLKEPQPQFGKNGAPAEGMVTLAEEDDDPTKSYPDILVEAIFSKELYPQDNLGDINRDGVPDYYASSYDVTGAGSTDTTQSTTTTDDETAKSTDTDLNNVAAANPDEDYLPAAAAAADPLNPGSRGWGPGRPFGFKLEVRGFGEGLNEPGISEYDLTTAETFALLKDYADAGHSVTDAWDVVYIAATNWAHATKWSVERRLDPTSPDTDSDGLDDGTEYFFWYYARAGRTAADGTWARLTGKRFLLAKPAQGEEIPSWVIAQAFDPLAARPATDRVTVADPVSGDTWNYNSLDFDDDGISDLEEIAMGLNPASFDSDNDGISDLWELMNGFDPLDPTDATGNPDRDFMARYDTATPFRTIFLENGSAWALEKADNAMTLAPLNDTYPSTNAALSFVSAGVSYYLAGTNWPDTVSQGGKLFLVRDTKAWTRLDWEGDITEPPEPEPPVKSFLGKPVTLPAGTQIAKDKDGRFFVETTAGACAVASSQLIHRLMPWDIDGDGDPDPCAGIRVYRYGTDKGGLIVPCKPIFDDESEYENYLPKDKDYGTKLAIWEIVEDKPLSLIHHQVMSAPYFGLEFDPRTAWSKLSSGYVAQRWNTVDTEQGKACGLAVNTVPYSNLDEYLLLQFRYMTEVQFGGLNLSEDTAKLQAGTLDLEDHFAANTTRPNIPFASASQSSGSSTNAVASGYSSTIHGADTDGDGIPDGWELYVNINPNSDPTDPQLDATWRDGWAKDGDDLCFLEEFAGLDSCAAYAPVDEADEYPECTTITANSPTQSASLNAGWLNKFFPSNPYDDDTDGDGLKDDKERSAFVYGSPEDDGKTICFAGGGLNPCTVDTDYDHLPDAWEWEFQGTVWNGTDKLDPQIAFNGVSFETNRIGNATAMIVGGMDGTFKGDPDMDFDHDGLLNYQEYLVQALRHLRYDDIETPLMGRELNWTPGGAEPKLSEQPFRGFLPMSTLEGGDGMDFYARCLAKGFTGLTAYDFSKLGYFATPPHAWDPTALNGFKVMLRPMGIGRAVTPDTVEDARIYAKRSGQGIRLQEEGKQFTCYVTTDPREADTDRDGMDDYYELFHGLNPLLGTSDDPMGRKDNIYYNWEYYDVIARSYGGEITAWDNGWTIWNGKLFAEPSVRFDAMRFPWMIGTPECDADGDGLRNADEMLRVNAIAPQNSHTDPTPLWMTDSSSTNYASFVAQYYSLNPYVDELSTLLYFGVAGSYYGWDWYWNIEGDMGRNGFSRRWSFTFEENEGYDTDHDYKPDTIELTKTVEGASDPLDNGDPARRQALYFPGAAVPGAAVSTRGTAAASSATEAELLKQFTVECWVRPDAPANGAEQVIVERASNYGPSTLSNNVSVMTANFRLGIDAAGMPFAEFTGTTGERAVSRIVSSKEIPAGAWTHLAATFNGTTFALYMNGAALPVAIASDVGIIPANGVTIMTMASGASFAGTDGVSGYEAVPTATILGARAVSANPLTLNGATTWADFTSFYQGYVAEVRVWDRARTVAQISANWKTAFTMEDVSDLRNEFYLAWKANFMSSANLPAQLVQHYNFAGLPGATHASYVAVEPPAFTEKVLDNVRIEGGKVPGGLVCGWWSKLDKKVRSRVYTKAEVVPWIHNTCAHLAYIDGSAPDSFYWGTAFSGCTAAQNSFPNSANPYPYVNFIYDRYWHSLLVETVSDGLAQGWTFELRSRGFIGTDDLVPLGSAYAQRGTDYWDGQGAMDAWTSTSSDSDGDGLPNWYETYVKANYQNPDGTALSGSVAWDQSVLRNGEKMTVAEAYACDLAEGLLPSGVVKPEYADTAKDDDGMLLWWKRLYGVASNSAYEDPDNDGLSIYAEYLSSRGDSPYGVANGFWKLDPMKAVTAIGLASQAVPDYFLPGPTNAILAGVDAHGFNRYLDTGSYLGEIFTDHDFMEDAWERAYAIGYANTAAYDPDLDADEDGWSNWAECRAFYWCGKFVADLIERYLDGEQEMACRPQPALGVRVTYHGDQDITGKGLVVRTFSGKSSRVDATFAVAGSGDSIVATDNVIIGGYTKDTVLRGFLNPGCVVPGDGVFQKGRLSSNKVLIWDYLWYRDNLGGAAISYNTASAWYGHGTYMEYIAELIKWPNIVLQDASISWDVIGTTVSDETGSSGQIVYGGSNSVVRTQIGTIDYRTGEYAIDLAKLAELDTDLQDNVFRVSYSYRIGATWPQTLYLSKPDVGFVKEGANTVEAFIDLDGDGAYTPGEPFGVAQNVMVGWHKTPVTVIELTDSSSVVPRYDLASGTSDRAMSAGSYIASSDAGAAPQDSSGAASGEPVKQVRIVRRAINGKTAPARVLMNKTFVLDDRAYIHEGDVLSADKLDLDWKWLVGDAAKLGFQPDGINTVAYDIEEVMTDGEGVTASVTLTSFVNTYGLGRAVPKAVSPVDHAPVYSAAPSFTWACGDTSMTAFRLEVRNAAGEMVYDSGYRRMPGRTGSATGSYTYTYTPPIYADAPVATNGAPVLISGSNYQWRVALYNAKYRLDAESAWSDWTPFQMDVANANRKPAQLTGYGRCAAAVRYYGVGRKGDLTGKIVVEAFGNADFKGQPAAQARVDLADGLLDSLVDATTVNVAFAGLEPGDWYLCAYIDSNNNGKRDSWESWGYANHVGMDRTDIYTPRAVTVVNSLSKLPSITLFIEDTDVNRNEIPDALEDLAAGETVTDSDKDGLSDEDEAVVGNSPYNWDSDGDGLPDGWEVKFVAEDIDGDYCPEYEAGDVMAYEEFAAKLVTLDDATGTRLLLAEDQDTPVLGDLARTYAYTAWYSYGIDPVMPSLYGVGTNVLVNSTVARVLKVEDVTAVRVHAQVYAKYGFEAGVATLADTKGRTKAFTALDKYLVSRYLQALGLADEAAMNAEGLNYTVNATAGSKWERWTCLPNAADGNADGVADGWALYVMFGKEDLGLAQTAADVRFSPWVTPNDARKAAPAGGLTWVQKYALGAHAMNPYAVDTDGDGVSDKDTFNYCLWEPFADMDNDGLCNWTEYVIQKTTGEPVLQADNAFTDGLMLDYFRYSKKTPKYYLGFKYTDHDFVEDWWEDMYDTVVDGLPDAKWATRYAWDARKDYDNDGWDNWSEARAGTDPRRSAKLSLVREDGSEDHAMEAYPVPTVHAKVSYNGKSLLSEKLCIKAWRGSSIKGKPDAVWSVAGTGEASQWNTRFLGLAPNRVVKFNLGPGAVAESHVAIEYYDPNWGIETITYNTNGTVKSTVWTPHNVDTSAWGLTHFGDDPSDSSFGQDTGSFVSYSADASAADNAGASGSYVNYYTGDITIDFTDPVFRQTDYQYVESAGGGAGESQRIVNHYDFTRSFWRVRWMSRLVETGNVKAFTLLKPEEASDESRGHLRQGINTFLVFADRDGDGNWSLGEPFGIVRNVDVGWDSATFGVELHDAPLDFPTFVVDSTNATERVRIVRTAVNGEPVEPRLVARTIADFADRNWLTAADFTAKGALDVDWSRLLSDATNVYGIAAADIRTVEYTIYVGSGTNAVPVKTFVKKFDAERVRPNAMSPSALEGAKVTSSQPVFVWSRPDEGAYVAFRLQVATTKDFGTDDLVYDVTDRLPMATAEGYAYASEAYVGDVLADGSNYFWRVALLNARFPVAEAAEDWSEPAAFTTAVGSSRANTGYGRVGVDLRYYGPATNALSSVTVEVWDNAGFVGKPLARKRLDGTGDVQTLTNELAGLVLCTNVYVRADGMVVTNIRKRLAPNTYMKAVPNVVFDGIVPGIRYVTAYIDANGNGTRDVWETWGYFNEFGFAEFGDAKPQLFAPRAVTVTSMKGDLPSHVLFMEDTDLNANGIPDCLEEDVNWTAWLDEDEEPDSMEDYDGDGLPGDWEDKNGLDDDDETDAEDEARVIAGDVMAYFDTNVTFVAVGTTSVSADWTWYAVMDLAHEPARLKDSDIPLGTAASELLSLRTVFEYGEFYGVGKAVRLGADAGTVKAATTGTVRLVHAQVYDAFGFNTFTANGQAYAAGTAVNTKPFTAMDKYLVCRYLENIGIPDVSEAACVTNGWKWTLDPNEIDADRDDIADGWELYVMFGGDYASVGKMDEVKISPFNAVDGTNVAPAETSMKLVEEFDGGYLPTDPWATDTDADGVSDADAYAFHLKGGDYRGDEDNDQLSNFVEYMITRGYKGYGAPTVEADRMFTAGREFGGNQSVPDYFLRIGQLYVGEMFTDHDFMETYLESSNGVRTLVGPLNAFRYDAREDADGDGWSNFSELRAFQAAGTYPVDVVTTNALGEVSSNTVDMIAYAGRPTPTVTLDVRYNGKQTIAGYVVKAYPGTDTLAAPDATWAGVTNLVGTKLVLGEPTSGALKEGKYTFVVYATMAAGTSGAGTGDAAAEADAWTPGAPYGVVAGVDVGWKQASAALELTDTNASIMRIDLAQAMAASDYESQYWLTDRGANGYDYYANYQVEANMSYQTALNRVRVRVVRCAVNGRSYNQVGSKTTWALATVFDTEKNLTEVPVLTEADLIANTQFDLDWGNMSEAASSVGLDKQYLESVWYLIVTGDGAITTITSNMTAMAVGFKNGFEVGQAQTMAVPDASVLNVKDVRPTFKWSHANTIDKAYPAFQLRVYRKDGDALVYDTGIRRAPARDANGVYVFTPENLHVGEATRGGQVFANNTDYYWTVSMLDAKFTTPNANETKAYFRTAVNGAGGALSDEGSIAVAVKYFGPVPTSVTVTSIKKLVRVEAFASPDFAGAPAAVTYAKNVDTLSATNQVTFNALLEGLPAGDWYVRAYIDTNGNRACDAGESWGYGNYVGTLRKDVYTPRAYTIVTGAVAMPEAVVYVEDVDADNNGLPDAWQGTKTVDAGSGPYTVAVNAAGTVETFDLFKKFDAGVIELPYVSMLTQMSDEDTLSSLRLDYALAMAGVTSIESTLEPVVTVRNFSLEEGIDLAVDLPTTITPETLKATQIKDISVKLTLTLLTTDSLDEAWTEALKVEDTFTVNTVDGVLDPVKLEALNAKIRDEAAKSPSAFFKVKAAVE